MLTSDSFLPNLIQLSQPASLLTCVGFYWNSSTFSFRRLSSRYFLLHRITTKVHLFLAFLVFSQTAVALSNFPTSTRMISSFALIILIFCCITVQVYHFNCTRCIFLINQFILTSLHIKKLYPPNHSLRENMDTKEKFIKLLAPTLHWSAMAVPFAFVGGVILSMPCMPSNLGYTLLADCQANSSKLSSDFLLPKPLFLLINLWIWSYGVQCAVFVVIFVMLGATSLRAFLKFYQQSMLSLNFTTTVSTPQRLRTLALIYRRIQLLANLFNAIHQSKILVPLVFTVTSHQVFSVYGAIKFAGQLNFVSYALFLILGSQGVLVIMGMFTGLADVYTMSRRVKARLQQAHRGHRWLRRFHKSCQLIQIRFGALNFIDSFTPLAFENFAVVQTTNILMVD